ncbi:Transcription factor basic helix-loop-helix 162, partial [Cucurbita argyrosperma subsp. sororia]
MADKFIHSSSSAKTDRKIIERNRREEMKALFSHLHSLVPNQSSTEGDTTLLDQLENATNYINQLKENVEKLKVKREKLMGSGEKNLRRGEIEARLLVQVDAHQLLQENGTQIVHINQSTVTDLVFHKIIAEMVGEGTTFESAEGERICKIVKKKGVDMAAADSSHGSCSGELCGPSSKLHESWTSCYLSRKRNGLTQLIPQL